MSFLALVLGLVLSSVANADDPNLVGWWELDEGEGQTAYDSAGSNDGTIYGATWTTGKLGGALEFDGNGDYIEVNNPTSFEFGTADHTMMMWMKRSGTGNNDKVFSKTADADWETKGKQFYVFTNDKLRWEECDVGNVESVSTIDTNWHHIAVTFVNSDNNVSLYIDGLLDNSSILETTSDDASHVIKIGARATSYFNGTIDDVRIYDRALSEQEIQALMQGSESQLLVGFRAPLLSEPASASAFQSKVGQGPSGSGPSTDDPEIQELARGLRYDPGLMYKFVHDYIRFYPIWGDLKGPYMTWMDRSGNGFDQASLMIALLKEAEQHCTEYTVTDPNYVVGEIELSETQAFEWLRIVDDADMARQVLARAGLYGICDKRWPRRHFQYQA